MVNLADFAAREREHNSDNPLARSSASGQQVVTGSSSRPLPTPVSMKTSLQRFCASGSTAASFFVILPSVDQILRFNVINQTGVGINPLSLPLVSPNVLDDSYPLERCIWRTLLA
jgi:hypothetical protein